MAGAVVAVRDYGTGARLQTSEGSATVAGLQAHRASHQAVVDNDSVIAPSQEPGAVGGCRVDDASTEHAVVEGCCTIVCTMSYKTSVGGIPVVRSITVALDGGTAPAVGNAGVARCHSN